MIQTVRRLERQIKRLKEENRRLTAENALLRKENNVLKRKICEQEKKKTLRRKARVKARTSGKKKKPGRKPGFKGTSRRIPDHVDEVVDVVLHSCPQCGAPFKESYAKRERYVEDVVIVRPYVTKYIIHRYYCSTCESDVSAAPDDVIPHCMLGIKVMLLVAYLKFELHLSYDKIRKNLEMCFGLKTTNATLCNAATLVSTYYKKEFDTIKNQIRKARAVYTDETGWKINGVNHWLWVFATENAAVFKIDKRRSSKVPKEVLGEDFDGVLVSDFYSAYHTKLPYKKQKCLVHLLRDSHNISETSEETRKFHKKIKRFVRDAAKFKEENHPQNEIAKAKKRFQRRLSKIIAEPYKDPDCIRLAKRLNQHKDSVLTFLEEDCDYHNNRAENALRKSVIMRKICFGNNSRAGADTHEIMMSALVTHNLRRENFLEEGAKFMRNQLGRGVTTRITISHRLWTEKNSIFSFFHQCAA